jgi:hypothetical protein
MKRDYQANNSYHHPSIWKVRVYEVLAWPTRPGTGIGLSIEILQEANALAKAAQDLLASEIKAGGYEVPILLAPYFEPLPMGGLKVEANVVVVPKGERKDFDKLFSKLRKQG